MKATRLIHKGQSGFTLIELLVAVAITGLIISGIAMTIFQLFTGHARTSNHMIAVRQVQNAGYWVSRDGKMAQNVNPTDNPATSELELVTLTWTDWDGNAHKVVYTLENEELWRDYSKNEITQQTILVAQFIDPTETNVVTGGGVLTLRITATVGTGQTKASETRVYRVVPRPGI